MGDCVHDFYWYPATNEDGWKCCACGHRPGEPKGFSPQLDREELARKVDGLLLDLHHAELIYVSNGSMGDSIGAAVTRRCHTAGLFDQYTIVRYLLEAVQPSHADYWKRISDGVVSGADERHRCHCGALANAWVGGKHYCREHARYEW